MRKGRYLLSLSLSYRALSTLPPFLCISPQLSSFRTNEPTNQSFFFFFFDGKLGHEVFAAGKIENARKLPAVFTADTFSEGKKYWRNVSTIKFSNRHFVSPHFPWKTRFDDPSFFLNIVSLRGENIDSSRIIVGLISHF